MNRRSFLQSAACAAMVAACAKPGPAKPVLGAWGVDLSGRNEAVKPGQDFFNYANGAWVERAQIPPDRGAWGSFYELDNRADEQVKGLIEEAAKKRSSAGPIALKIGAYYNTFMDEAAIEAKGATPVKASLAQIEAAADRKTLCALFGAPGLPTPIVSYVNLDSKNTSRYLLNLTQAGLGMPNRDYYLKPQFKDAARKYQAFLAQLFTLAGYPDGAARAGRAYALERKIAEVSWPIEEQRDAIKTYNLTKIADLPGVAPGVDWAAMLGALGAGDVAEVNLGEKSAIARIAALVGSKPLADWKDWMLAQRLNGAAPFLGKAFTEARFEFYGKALQGQEQMRERWKRGVDVTSGAMGQALGQLYVAKYFPAASKAEMGTLVANLTTAYRARLEKLDWMSPETKQKAFDKLAAFGTKIGYPDKWRDYAGLDVQAGDALGNSDRATAFEIAYEIGKLKRPIDPDEWLMDPQAVNAYYWAERNEIVFPAGILQAPFFDPAADPAVNYGAIGAVIGHEMTHGFDDQGRLYDGKGMLRQWWSKEDDARFTERAQRLVDLYATFEPLPGVKLNGRQTLGENIADLGGVVVAYDAYKLSLKGKEAPVIDGLTGDQRFFLAYAQVWRTKYRDQELQRRATADVHSPGMFRVNGVVRNVDAWYQAFNVADGAMFTPPEQRARIW